MMNTKQIVQNMYIPYLFYFYYVLYYYDFNFLFVHCTRKKERKKKELCIIYRIVSIVGKVKVLAS